MSVTRVRSSSSSCSTDDCRDCSMRAMGLFADLNDHDFDLVNAPIDAQSYPAGATVYEHAAPAKGVFVLRSGLIKLLRCSADGHQRIVRVLREGDVAGLEALATADYAHDAVALTDVALCRVPLSVVHSLGKHSPRMHQTLMRKWQLSLKEADDWLGDLNCGTARQRVAHLALKMRDLHDTDLVTLFPRDDMGSMLNLKPETVSREISALVRDQILAPVDKLGRAYRIQQLERLQAR